MGPDSLPTHAYVPGHTERHPEGAFDAIRDTASADLDENELAASDAFQSGLRFLEAGYYWEAHEVLEPVWLALPKNAVARSVVQGLIQLANARLKVKMEKPNAARRLYNIADEHLNVAGESEVLGLDVHAIRKDLEGEIAHFM